MELIRAYPLRTLLAALLAALVLALIFHWTRRYVAPLLHGRRASRLMERWLPRMEIIAWAFLLGACAVVLLELDPVVTSAGLVIIGAAGWSFWKDLFAGCYFRLAGRFLPGDPVQVGAIAGKVNQARTRDLEITTSDGGLAWIPYHTLTREVIVQRSTSAKAPGQTFTIQLPEEAVADGVLVIRQLLMRDPWVATSRPISITDKGSGLFAVDLHLVDPQALDNVQVQLKKELGAASAGQTV